MKRILSALIAAIVLVSSIADAQTPLRQSTSRVVRIGPAVAVGDGFTPVTNLALGTADEAEALRANTATLDISSATFTALTGADGWYSLTLDTTATNTVGDLTVVIQDDSLILPLYARFTVVEEAVYDRDYDAAATGIIGTAQTGDAFARIGAPTGASLAADLVVVDGNVDDIEASIGTVTNLGGGATLAANNADMAGGTFSSATDSNEAIRDRGDAAWTTGGGGAAADLLESTTIATLSTQTSFTLTAGSADNDAYTDRAMVVVTDQTTSTQKAVGWISDYVGSTKTVTLRDDPGVFTMAVGDSIDIVAAISAADVQYWNGTVVTTPLETAADIADAVRDEPCGTETSDTLGDLICNDLEGVAAGSITVEANVASVSGDAVAADNAEAFFDGTGYAGTNNVIPTVTTLTGHTAQTGDNFARLGAPVGASISADLQIVDGNVDDIETDTADMQPKLGTPIDFGSGTSTIAANLQDMADDGTAVFDRTTDSLQAIADSGGGGPTAVQIRQEMDSNSTQLAAIVADTNELQTDDYPARFLGIEGSTFNTATDSLEAIRDRGDVAWTTGGGTGMTALFSGTMQSGSTSTTAVLSAATTIPDDNPNFDVQICIHTGTGLGQCRLVEDWDSTTDTATVSRPWTTTPDNTSIYEGWPAGSHVNAWAADIASVETGLENSGDIADSIRSEPCGTETSDTLGDLLCNDLEAVAADLADGGRTDLILDQTLADTADIQPKIGTVTNLGGGATLSDNNADIAGATFNSATDSNEAIRDRGDAAWVTGVGGDGSGLTSIPWNSAWDIEVESEATDALNAYDPPTNTEMNARTLATAAYFDPVADAVANVTLVGTTTTNTDMRGTDNAATAAALTTHDGKLDTADTVVDAIKVKTDQLTFTKTGEVDANTKSMNDAEVCGDGDVTLWTGACP